MSFPKTASTAALRHRGSADPYTLLALGILTQAVMDYRDSQKKLTQKTVAPESLKVRRQRERLTECDAFIRRGWLSRIMNIDGDAVLKQLDRGQP